VQWKSSLAHALLAVFLLSVGSGGCVKRPVEAIVPPCPAPNEEAIASLRNDDIPEPILEYLIDIDMFCNAIDSIRD